MILVSDPWGLMDCASPKQSYCPFPLLPPRLGRRPHPLAVFARERRHHSPAVAVRQPVRQQGREGLRRRKRVLNCSAHHRRGPSGEASAEFLGGFGCPCPCHYPTPSSRPNSRAAKAAFCNDRPGGAGVRLWLAPCVLEVKALAFCVRLCVQLYSYTAVCGTESCKTVLL